MSINNNMQLVLDRDGTSEIYVLIGSTPATKEVPKQAGFRWDSLNKRWWTDDEAKARQLAHLAQNGLCERWNGRQPAAAPALGAVVGTPQQEAFWQAVVSEDGHIVLLARAGTGKTFSVIEGARRVLNHRPAMRVGFSAFNAHIAKELKDKVPDGCEAFTLHSLGLRALTRHLGRRPSIDDGKVRALLDQMALPTDRNRGKVDRALVKACVALVGLCKAYLYDGQPAQLDELVMRHEVDLDPISAAGKRSSPSVFNSITLKPRVYALVPQLLEACRDTTSVIDYDDMLWLPLMLDIYVPTYDLLFIDECQDMNRNQQELAFMACPTGRIVIVGDDRQAIYAFRGADVRSVPRMTEMLGSTSRGCQTLPLTFTRRCPKQVVALAREIVPDIEPMPEAPEGIVEHIAEKDFSQRATAGDMVLCRTNAPLVGAAHQFLRAGKKAVLRGKDLSGQIRDLIEGLGAQTIEELADLLMRYRMVEAERLENAGKSAQVITAHEDRCDTLTVLMEGCPSLVDLEQKITRIFDSKDETDAIILSSVHGAKGLEAETVYILRPDLMPHPNAKSPEDCEQEQNIRYVALTRSKHRMVFVGDMAPKRAGSGGTDSGDADDAELDLAFDDIGADDIADEVPVNDLRPEDEGYDVLPLGEDLATEDNTRLPLTYSELRVLLRFAKEHRDLLGQTVAAKGPDAINFTLDELKRFDGLWREIKQLMAQELSVEEFA